MSMKPGDRHYRAYVGDPANYDLIAATVFNLLTTLGLRDRHKVLDVGCGSLRNARLLIPYLQAGGYVGIEPNRWLVEEGMDKECGRDLITLKQARFSYRADCAELDDNERFDFILLQSIFSHCGEDLLRQWLRELVPHLDEDGAIIATWVYGEQNSGESGWIYPGLVSFTEDSFRALVEEAGLICQPLDWPHPIQRWAMLTRSQVRLDWVADTGLSFANAFRKMRKPRPGTA